MRTPPESKPSPRRVGIREILLYGVCGGLLIVALRLAEYRFLVVEHSMEVYGAIVAALFAGLGIWLGKTLTRPTVAASLWVGGVRRLSAGGQFDSLSS